MRAGSPRYADSLLRHLQCWLCCDAGTKVGFIWSSVEDIQMDGDTRKTNKELVDDNNSQQVSHEEIDELKKQGAKGEDIIQVGQPRQALLPHMCRAPLALPISTLVLPISILVLPISTLVLPISRARTAAAQQHSSSTAQQQ